MRAIVLENPGAPQGLVLKDIPVPKPGPHQALVRVRAVGVCHHDVVAMRGLLRRGIKPKVVLGHEIAGEVVETGPQVQTLTPGQRVVSILTNCCGWCPRCVAGNEHRCLHGRGIGHGADGGYAEFVVIAEPSLRPMPASVPFEHAAICACPIGVILRAIRSLARVKPGETVVVTGAGGGLGIHGLQIAKSIGARVLAVTTSANKIEQIRALGPDEVIFSPDLQFHWEVLALTGEEGADVVLDTVGSLTFEASFQALAQYGRLVLAGEITGGQVAFNPATLLFKDAILIGASGVSRSDLDDALLMVQRGTIKPVVTPFPLAEAPKVHQMLLDRLLVGRAVLIP